MKRLVGLVMGAAAVLGLGVSSVAADYPVGTAALTTTNGSPVVGEPITLTATNFPPGYLVTFTGGTLGSAVANGVGTATITTNATTVVGSWVVTATCSLPCDRSATVTMNVRAGSTIPRTGSDSTFSTLLLGALVVGAGGALIGLAALRRRRLVAA